MSVKTATDPIINAYARLGELYLRLQQTEEASKMLKSEIEYTKTQIQHIIKSTEQKND